MELVTPEQMEELQRNGKEPDRLGASPVVKWFTPTPGRPG